MPLPHPARSRRLAGAPGRLRAAGLALALLTAACASNPSDGADLTDEQKLGVYFENALWYLEMGDIERAQFQAEKALEIDPDNERFLLIYGQTNVRLGTAASIAEALTVFDKRPDLDDWRWQQTYAMALERKGLLFDEASSGVRDGSRPTNAKDRGQRADELSAEAREHWERSRERYEKSIADFPGEPGTLNGLVRTNALLGDFEESLRWTDELIASIRDSQALVRVQLAAEDISADRENDLRDAARTNRSLEVKARLHAATLLRRLGQKREAVKQFDSIVELEPELAQAYSLKAQLLVDLEEFVKARAALQRFLDLTDLPFDDPQVRRAFDLQDRCERALRAAR